MFHIIHIGQTPAFFPVYNVYFSIYNAMHHHQKLKDPVRGRAIFAVWDGWVGWSGLLYLQGLFKRRNKSHCSHG